MTVILKVYDQRSGPIQANEKYSSFQWGQELNLGAYEKQG